MKKEIAVIGYGRFGRCATHHLKKRFRVIVSDSHKITRVEKGITKVSIEEAAKASIILLAVPINQITPLLKKIAPKLRPNALICDVCSVKTQPIQWMKRHLPQNVFILGTHPLFGPDSASESIQGRTIVLCPVKIPSAKLRHIHEQLMSMGLNVSFMTPQQHDRLMATTLFLTQLVGRGLLQMKLPRTSTSTQNFQLLQQLVQTVKNDTKELFRDMYRYNRYAYSIPKKLADVFQKTHHSLRRTR